MLRTSREPWALLALVLVACAQGDRLESTNNVDAVPDAAGSSSAGAGGRSSYGAGGSAASTISPGGVSGAAGSLAGGASGASGGFGTSVGGAAAAGASAGGVDTGADAGTASICADQGRKSCGGLCVTPSPAIGCSLTDCTACPEVANATLTCNGESCDFDCDTGYVKDATGCSIPPDCADGVLDGTETDVDCGGGGCAACAPGGVCLVDTDCDRGPCVGGVCGCTAATCATATGCGSGIDDGCGGTITCSCSGGQICDQGVCCAPSICGGVSCGSFADGCGGTIDCGCSGSDVCDQGACCTPSTCGAGDCGVLSNGCGGTKDCGLCAGCDDGVQNQSETGVDCGGACLDCPWARWAMNEAGGTTAVDWSGSGRNGTLVNFPATPWGTGQLGGALSFDGTDDYVSVGSDPPPAGAITITAWISTKSTGNEGRIVVSKRDNNQSNRAEFQFGKNASGVGPTDEMVLSFNVGGTWYVWYTTNLKLNTNTWTHVAVSYAETAGPVFYKNGSAVGSTQWGGPGAGSGAPARPTNTAETRVGGAVNAPESPWSGSLDDVRIYGRVLSASEIMQVMSGS